ACLRERGHDTMRGPMNPSVNDDCGLLVEGFDTPPTLMMPHNPRYYPALHDAAGLRTAKDLLAYENATRDMPERLARAARLVAERGGKVIGFAVALPDLNVALKHNPSGRLYGLPLILWHARKISRARILLLGALPEYRHTGVDALMYQWIWEKGNAHGIYWGEAGWVLEDNAPMNNALVRIGFRVYKTYR